jgi:hypothetical protein
MANVIETTRRVIRDVQEEGFRDGTQGLEPLAFPKEVKAAFEQKREAVRYKSTDEVKRLEADLKTVDLRISAAEDRWQMLTAALGSLPPAVLFPLVATLCSAVVVLGEALFLAPVMDGLGVSEYYEQRCLAAVIVLVASGAFEITKKLYHRLAGDVESGHEASAVSRPSDWSRRVLFGFFTLMTTVTLAFVGVLGWWRAEEMAFAATATSGAMQNGEWSRFLSDNLALTRAFVVLLALLLPLFVAFAFEWGTDRLRLAVAWRRARRALDRLPQERARAEKALEAAGEKRDCQVRALDEEQSEWTETYMQAHELGGKVGAWRLPLWQVVAKVVAVTLLFAGGCFLVNLLVSGTYGEEWFASARLTIALLVTLGAGGLYAYYAFQVWDRPTPRQLFSQRATLWRNATRGDEPQHSMPSIDHQKSKALSGLEGEGLTSASITFPGASFAGAHPKSKNGNGSTHHLQEEK